ncbi:MAG: magnesium/cobalt transporter CorA [Verrucomicrobiaceae bacterium]|nr:MAG: magnesium/cobalt transporter CorA [Verrucomicrobiaceae bacterium]
MHKRYSIPGSSPATLVPKETSLGIPPELRVTEYGPDFLEERKLSSVAELPDIVPDRKMCWIEMDGLGDVEALRALGKKYGLHPLALEDTLNTGQRPKVEAYEDHLFIIAQMVYRDKELQMCGEQVSIFLGPGFLITIQEEPHNDVFDPVRERLRSGRGFIRKQGSDYLGYALLDSIIDHIFPVLEAVGDSIEELEDEILEKPTKECPQRLHEYKRILMHLRRFVWPERDVISSLLHDDTGLISKQTKVYLRDCYDHTVQIMDLIESYRDVVSGLMEMYLSMVGMRTNEVMRVLTVISAIFIPLTFIAGVYGMNFASEADGRKMPWNMPELYSPYGYVACILLMAIIAIAQLVYFKRKGWL